MKQYKKIAFILLLLILLFLFAEFQLRLYENIRLHIPFLLSPSHYFDPVLGWNAKFITREQLTKKYKIFVIGDSFTLGWGSPGVPEERMYYNQLKNKFDAEIFVSAGGGYATLQEYLVLDKYIGQIRPDLIILQVCSNDFINNSWQLESASFLNNNLAIRPYLIDGRIVYRYPRFWGACQIFLSAHSRLFYRFFILMERAAAVFAKRHYFGLVSVDEIIAKKGIQFDKFKDSVAITQALLQRIQSRAQGIPVVAFTVDDTEPYLSQFKDIFGKINITFIDDIPGRIAQEEKKGINMRLKDGAHWNATGQQLCGELLARKLYELGYGHK